MERFNYDTRGLVATQTVSPTDREDPGHGREFDVVESLERIAMLDSAGTLKAGTSSTASNTPSA